jgi:hypothetical protein
MNNLVSVFIAVSEYTSPHPSESLLVTFFSFFNVRPDLINLDKIQMKVVQIVFSYLFTVTSSQFNPIAYCILVMTCCSGYSANTPFLGKQCQGSQNFIQGCVQVKKWRPSVLAKTVSTGFTSKKGCGISAIYSHEKFHCRYRKMGTRHPHAPISIRLTT